MLGLFTEQHPTWSADAINEALGFSRPTGYRYVRELVSSGLVARIAPGTYALGPRIIELDFQIRLSDPLLKAGLPVIQELVESTGCEVNLIGLYGDHIVTTHQQPGIERLPLSFGRGRPFAVRAPKSSSPTLAKTNSKNSTTPTPTKPNKRAWAPTGTACAQPWRESKNKVTPCRKANSTQALWAWPHRCLRPMVKFWAASSPP